MLTPGKRGIGFGVGREPLASLLAKYGCFITASDQSDESAFQSGCKSDKNNQHSSNLDMLFKAEICSYEQFFKHVIFEIIDMNHIPKKFQGYDFTWSSCSLEHLGSLKKGIDFIKNSLECLNSGGIAVHTTEFNLSSDSQTLEDINTVIYRKKDIESFIHEVFALGHTVFPLNLNPGYALYDSYIDVPPYKSFYHLKLKLDKYHSTSIGLIIKKK